MKFTAAALTLGLASAASAQLSAVPIIEAIAPLSKDCSSPPPYIGNQPKDQCRTAEQLAGSLISAFFTHGVYSVKQMAAVVALMAFESGDFEYKLNQVEAHHGQGTANMQSPAFNLKYGRSIPDLAEQFKQFPATVDGMSPEQLDKMVLLLTDDKYNFGSGPWFLMNECGADVRSLLDSNPDAGFAAYMGCVGVTVDDKRNQYWQRAKSAFQF